MRFALAPALVVLAAAVARPAEPLEPPRTDALAPALAKAKARRAALDRLAGPHPPFDLTYLPRPANEIQALVGFRPALLFAHPDLAPAAAEIAGAGARVLRRLGGNLAGPGLPELDQLLVCGSMTVVPVPDPTDGRTASFVVGANGVVARAARPFDWAAAVLVRLPRAEHRTHAGAAFLAVRFDLGFFSGLPPGGIDMAFYAAPDGRTLVADSVANVTALLDRLRAGEAVAPPPGWDQVDRAAVAVAIDNRNKQWVSFLPYYPGPVTAADGIRLFRAADQFAAGLDAGPVTRFRLVAYCRDPFQARHARRGLREALARLSDRFAPGEADTPSPEWAELGTLTDALLKDGTTTPTPLGLEYVSEAPGDLLGLIARLADTTATPPRPTHPPAGFPPPPVSAPLPADRSNLNPWLPTLSSPGSPGAWPAGRPGGF